MTETASEKNKNSFPTGAESENSKFVPNTVTGSESESSKSVPSTVTDEEVEQFKKNSNRSDGGSISDHSELIACFTTETQPDIMGQHFNEPDLALAICTDCTVTHVTVRTEHLRTSWDVTEHHNGSANEQRSWRVTHVNLESHLKHEIERRSSTRPNCGVKSGWTTRI